MQLQFLGTASGTPGRTRNVAGVAPRRDGGNGVPVGCGEGTQRIKPVIRFTSMR